MSSSLRSKRLFRLYNTLLMIFLVIFPLVAISGCGNESYDIKINATVYYSDVQDFFTIINDNNFGWYDVKLFLNYEDDDLTSGYRYDVKRAVPVAVRWKLSKTGNLQILMGGDILTKNQNRLNY